MKSLWVLVTMFGTAHAATITVTTRAESATGCTIASAILAANTDAAVGGCAAGSGADVIAIPAGTYGFASTHSGGDTLPAITSAVTLAGADRATTILAPAVYARILAVRADAPVTIRNLTFRGGYYDGSGVGFFATAATASLTISDCRFENAAFNAISTSSPGLLTITNTVVAKNPNVGLEATGNANVVVTNSTFAQNRIGVLLESHTNDGQPALLTATLNNVTIVHNAPTASAPATAVSGLVVAGGNVHVRNSIIALNTGTAANPNLSGISANLSDSLIGGGTTGSDERGNIFGVDPNFAAVTSAGLYPLSVGSPARDAASTATTEADGACATTDALGQSRSGRCDMGAIELQSASQPPVATVTDPAPSPAAAIANSDESADDPMGAAVTAAEQTTSPSVAMHAGCNMDGGASTGFALFAAAAWLALSIFRRRIALGT